jgi:sulfopropanediol 3-dehydrogenase
MATYLKKSIRQPEREEEKIRDAVRRMLEDVRNGGEAAVRELAVRHDAWTGDFVLSRAEAERLSGQIPERVKKDIRLAHDRVRSFAVQQRKSLVEFEMEPIPGLTLGQRLVPCQCAGCYIPGGRFAYVASAIMSVATAKAAGVPLVVACTPPHAGRIHPAVIYTLHLCGADTILIIGGVQAIGAMAYGLFTGTPADIIVGPGNRFVAEAKKMLYGEVGIDVVAGPTELAIIADETADPLLVSVDLASQAEHGPDSPVWLITDSAEVAEKVLRITPEVMADLPNPEIALAAWRDHGEVVLCDNREEMATVSDRYAAEHVQVIASSLDWWLQRLKNYGSLFLGEACTVAFGDKASGTNHILPTNRAARYSGGLSVHKFVKVLTYQKMTAEANREIGSVTSRISRLEGMEGHARAADLRLRRYFPNEVWDFEVYSQKRVDPSGDRSENDGL